jgi:hydrogenase/urease accessory protein HupE
MRRSRVGQQKGAGVKTRLLRVVAVAGVVAALPTLAPAVAYAHGVSGHSQDAYGFVELGLRHMLLGWDHLLFIGGVALLAGTFQRAVTFVSLFALGHSITLFTATVSAWQVDPVLVDIAVALSLVFVGVVGWCGRPKDWTLFGTAVFAFGLVHGLGLSTRLQELSLPDGGVISRVLAFNAGVEIAQIAALSLIAMAAHVITTEFPRLQRPRLGYSGLIAAGLVAASVLTVTGLP